MTTNKQGEPTLVVWVLYDATADKKYIKASDDGALAIFDNEAAARRARAMSKGSDYKRVDYYTTPQPAEQQPADSADVRLDKQCRQDVAAALGFPRGGNYAWSYLLQQIKDAVISAEQKPAEPDVAGLVETLEGALNGRPLDTEFWDRCEQFIAAHRKQQEGEA